MQRNIDVTKIETEVSLMVDRLNRIETLTHMVDDHIHHLSGGALVDAMGLAPVETLAGVIADEAALIRQHMNNINVAIERAYNKEV